MKRWVPAVVVALLTVTAALLVVGLNAPTSASPGAQSSSADDAASEPARVASDGHGHGHGPPPWAHGAKTEGENKGWHQTWKDMSPSQRRNTMAKLADEHERGLREWRLCVSADQGNCKRPLPPGLAKKQLAR